MGIPAIKRNGATAAAVAICNEVISVTPPQKTLGDNYRVATMTTKDKKATTILNANNHITNR